MREIQFKGKCIQSGDWVYGDLIHGVNFKKNNTYILPIQTNLAYVKHCDPLDGVRVDPETIGQSTGLFDSNENMIFDGDVIGDWNVVDGKNVQSRQQVFWNEFTASYHVDNSFEQDKSISEELWQALNDSKYEIVGNIHEIN